MARSKFLSLIAVALHIATWRNVSATPLSKRATQPVVVNSATLNGETYVNKGLAAFGLIPSNFRESTGDTLGGIGSAIAIKPGSWANNGTAFTGTLLVHPDRGYNVIQPIDYQARQHEIDFVLTPYYSTTKLSFASAQETLQLTYRKTTLLTERNNAATTGLDGLGVRAAEAGFPSVAEADPPVPIVSSHDPRLTLDVEGLVASPDGTFWISDEYGPYIYQFSANKALIQTIEPPRAYVPLDVTGALNFTSLTDPTTGRSANQGFEGLTIDPNTQTLYAMLQSATIQDGGAVKETARYTRLIAYDVSDSSVPPPIVGEWVVPLPLSSKSKALACSEIHFVKPGVFLGLARDGDGHGGDDTKSKYKNADLFSIIGATDIHGTKFDDPANPVSPGGVLDSSIAPATWVPFVSYIDKNSLARFGLHNDDPSDQTLIDAKWESLALAPVGDSASPDDYFLFTVADNDFLSTNGVSLGVPFNAGIDIDTQFMVWRVTLPGLPKAGLCGSLGINC